ncbi:CBS domain-containing protein [Methanococcoides sp. FTZ1]|uniref:CBS domain-containing protein n=1 Tax=Methanococcoides sp. FTZ1 TaxID=3439061 RepID=UPI003F8381DE
MADKGDEDSTQCGRSFSESCNEKLIRQVMTKDLVTIHEDDPLDKVLETFSKHHFNTYPVVNDDHELVGIINQDIILRILLVQRTPRLEHTHHAAVVSQGEAAKDIMIPHPVSMSSDEPLCEAADMMLKHKMDRVCVIEDGKLVGIICKPDILNEIYKLRGSL